MPFESADAYRLFATSVKHNRRFIYERQIESFLEAVTETSVARVQTLRAGQILWRAQLGSTSRIQDEGTPEEIEVQTPFSRAGRSRCRSRSAMAAQILWKSALPYASCLVPSKAPLTTSFIVPN